MRWTGAEIAYLIERWHDEDASNNQIAAGMAEACGTPLRTDKSIGWCGIHRLGLGPRPQQMAWWRVRESELRRCLLVEGLSLSQTGKVLARSRNAVAGAKRKLGWGVSRKVEVAPKYEPRPPRIAWAERPFPGVVL